MWIARYVPTSPILPFPHVIQASKHSTNGEMTLDAELTGRLNYYVLAPLYDFTAQSQWEVGLLQPQSKFCRKFLRKLGSEKELITF